MDGNLTFSLDRNYPHMSETETNLYALSVQRQEREFQISLDEFITTMTINVDCTECTVDH